MSWPARGADRFASKNGFEIKDVLEIYEDGKDLLSRDAFGVIQLIDGHFRVAITTSGTRGIMFGRFGDSPLVGSGFYCEDGQGACIATGDGEVCLRSVMAKEAVDRLSMGEPVEGICERVLKRGLAKLNFSTELSLLAVDKDGYYDAASTFEIFPFSYISQGIINSRYIYQGQEYKEDPRFFDLYKGD